MKGGGGGVAGAFENVVDRKCMTHPFCVQMWGVFYMYTKNKNPRKPWSIMTMKLSQWARENFYQLLRKTWPLTLNSRLPAKRYQRFNFTEEL